MKLRWAIITAVGAKLVEQGHHVFGPITESFSYVDFGTGECGWDYWKKHDLLMIEKCDELWVAKMPGWNKSVGVKEEVRHAYKHNKIVKYIDVHDILPELKDII